MTLRDAAPDPDPILLLKAWWRVAGPSMARAVLPRGYQDGRLELGVPDPRWLREMQGHLQELIQRLRRERGMGGLREIQLVLEPAGESAPGLTPLLPQEVEAAETPADILAAARAIPDQDLALRWGRVVGRILAASRRRTRNP